MQQIVSECTGAVSDAHLIEQARGGSRDALATVFVRHHPPTLRYARTLTRCAADAEDVTAEALLRMMSALTAGKGPTTNVPAYLRTAVRRLWVDMGTQAVRSIATGLDVGDGWTVVAGSFADTDIEHDSTLRQAFLALPSRWRHALWLVDVQGYRPAELATALGVTPPAACSLLWRARKALRARFDELDGARVDG
ncbi:RNA polymerase sigma factor [Saccharomonospora sp. NPDC046836]|uniref:RNA polymerase sigma factor n=1 Tax=Saccharomonospora sp. NPDC046836 TaxID=3156921 RepID=UPI0033C4437B